MYELAYYTIPLYNTSTYASADDDQITQMLALTQDAVDQTNAYAASLTGLSDSDFSSALLGYFSSVVTSALPESTPCWAPPIPPIPLHLLWSSSGTAP